MSSALTSGRPPPSSVASVRAICDVANLRAIVAEHRQPQDQAIEARLLARLPHPDDERDDRRDDRSR